MLVRANADTADIAFLLLGPADVYTTSYIGNAEARPGQVGGAVHAQVYAKMSTKEKETIQWKIAEINEVGMGNKETPPSSPNPL
jgi:hypothetical protein